MAIRPIRLFGDPILKTICSPVSQIDAAIRAHATDLLDTVDLDGRAGVASNQIGNSKRMFSLNVEGKKFVLINPEIIETSENKIAMGEGCLSVPNLWFDVMRYEWVKVRATDLDGKEVVMEGKGLLGQALQHEIDHLDAKLYLDRLNLPERGKALRQIRSSSWF